MKQVSGTGPAFESKLLSSKFLVPCPRGSWSLWSQSWGSPDLFAIHADSSLRGSGLSPALECVAEGSWRGTAFSWPGWTKCR
ncbi:hypothetical protein AV530_019976 [Patagioenas fasciata monilis]|uniref:Uncharacterized protein n=1 Tax=Patagioenas fasciata monilis TaxID=372326 RepID=A0A1V4JHN4_PATFA|nr:hypothetical protein AV530_019976 [Patagioenas fasciata monilis]